MANAKRCVIITSSPESVSNHSSAVLCYAPVGIHAQAARCGFLRIRILHASQKTTRSHEHEHNGSSCEGPDFCPGTRLSQKARSVERSFGFSSGATLLPGRPPLRVKPAVIVECCVSGSVGNAETVSCCSSPSK